MRSPSRFLFRTSIISDLFELPFQFIKIDYVSLICCYQTLSIQSADYVIFDNMPVVSDNRPVESDNMPVESDNMPVESDNMPVDSDNMPVHCSS